MKITFEILGIILLLLAATSVTMYFIQRKREQRAQRDGLVVYATLVSVEPIRGFGKVTRMRKIVLRVQEPDSSPREVTIRSGVEPGQKFVTGSRVPLVIDPTNSKRVYPANAESAKRAIFTGSRQERRMMQSQMRTPSPSRGGRRPPSGYQPPISKLR
jgi:hypothetical protein